LSTLSSSLLREISLPSQFGPGTPVIHVQVLAALHRSSFPSSTTSTLLLDHLGALRLYASRLLLYGWRSHPLWVYSFASLLGFSPPVTLGSPSGVLPGDVESRPYLHLFLLGSFVASASKHCELLSFLR